MPFENNYLLNPKHPDFAAIVVQPSVPFVFDQRLFGSAASEQSLVANPEPVSVRETILIVEKHAGIRAMVKKILKRQNYIVLEAASAADALNAVEEHGGKLDLMIADMTALQLDRSHLGKKITAQYPKTKVLYLSRYTAHPSAKSGDIPERTEFLQRPFTLESLLNKVKEVLEIKPK